MEHSDQAINGTILLSKGAAMFAKRKQKSEKWVVAENQPKPSAALAEQNVQPAAAAPAKPVTTPATPTNYRAEQNQKINTVQVTTQQVSNSFKA